MNLYITATFFIVMRQDPGTRKRVMSEMDSIRLSSEKDYRKPMVRSHKSFEMRNVYGKKIVMEDTPEKRFAELNKMWGKGVRATAKKVSGRNEYSSCSVVEL